MKKLIFFLLFLLFCLPSITGATVYFVRDDGNDSYTGLSDAQAWRTISKVNGFNFSTGDDVYFKCDDTWTSEALSIDWSGNSGDYVTIGAYYGSGTIGVSGNKPIIDGNHEAPSNQYLGLVQVGTTSAAQHYVTIENLRVINSEGNGVYYYGYDNSHHSTNGIIRNVDVNNTTGASIQFYRSDYGLIENCTATLGGMGYHEGTSAYWPGCVGSSQNCSYITVRKCKVYNVFGEGIGFYKISDYCIAEYNLVYNAYSVGIYLDATKHCTIRYNMIYGTTDETYWRHTGGSRTSVGHGLGTADERNVTPRCEYNEFYGNLVAFCASGIYFSTDTFTGTNNKVINNTFVGNAYGIRIYNGGAGWANSEIKNNIFWLAGGISLYNGPSTTPGLTWSNNIWSSNITRPASTNDVIGDPRLHKTTGWLSLTAGSLSASDFALQAGSPAIDAGVNLGATYDDILDAEQTTLPDTVTLLDQDSYGSGWEIGADIYTGGATVTDPAGYISVGSITEVTIQNTGLNFYIDLTDAQWVETIGDDNEITTGFIAALDGNLTCGACWDAVVKAGLTHANITRTSDTKLTITSDPFASFDLSVSEIVSLTIPANCTTAGTTIATNSFPVSVIQEADWRMSAALHCSTGKHTRLPFGMPGSKYPG